MLAIFATQITLMKKYILAAFCFSIAVISNAQKAPVKTAPKTPAKTTATKTSTAAKPATPSTKILKTKDDSLSYAIGLSVANFYKQQGIKLNTVLVTRALNDIVAQKKTFAY